MGDTVKVWLTGLTVVAVGATVFSSPYAANIFTAFFKGVGGSYNQAKH
jgi:hypothetical protein